MAYNKIVDEAEVKRWFEEGRTYKWMQEQYRDKYNLETSMGMWGQFRVRHGLSRRINRDDELIPWEVKEEHRWAYPLAMLRAEARKRAGMELKANTEDRLSSFLETLRATDRVIHYDRDTDEGFFLVPRRSKEDTDIIRKPDRKAVLSQRRNVDRSGA